MRAMVTPQFGGSDLFEEREVETPHPGPGPGHFCGNKPCRRKAKDQRRLRRARDTDNLRRGYLGRRRGGRTGSRGLRNRRRGVLHAGGLRSSLERGLRRVPRHQGGHSGEEACISFARGGGSCAARRRDGLRGASQEARRAGRRDGPDTRRGRRVWVPSLSRWPRPPEPASSPPPAPITRRYSRSSELTWRKTTRHRMWPRRPLTTPAGWE